MERHAFAVLTVGLALVAGCGNNAPTRSADTGVDPNRISASALPSGVFGSVPPQAVASPSALPTIPAVTTSPGTLPVPGATPSASPTDAGSATAQPSPLPTNSPFPLPSATQSSTPAPTASPTPGATASPSVAPSAAPSTQPAPSALPSYLSANILKQWTTGWSILGTKRAHVEVQAINSSFFYGGKATLEVLFTSGGAIVETQNLLISLDQAAIVDYTVDSTTIADAAQIVLLPAP